MNNKKSNKKKVYRKKKSNKSNKSKIKGGGAPPPQQNVSNASKIDTTGEYVQIAKMPSIDALIDGQVAGLEWLDSVDHLLERYPDDSRTEAFSGIKIPMD